MNPVESDGIHRIEHDDVSRRSAIGRLVIGGAAVVAGSRLESVAAQEPASATGECVAMAPAAEDGIGFAALLVGGIIQDVPTGPVDVHISRFTLEPGAEVPMAPQPYAQLVYVETGELTCPDNPGKLMYGPDGEVMYETTGKTEWHTCTPGMTWHVPAGVEDAAVNEGSELMSALVIELAPVGEGAAPTT
jgi:quercetin dioxygenase-like cupin family protein